MLTKISVRGAREHNLKDVSVEIPRDTLTVITGLSGSGKSSLAFDTIYAEGQRRYVESLSAYARQFLEMMQKPDVDQIDGLSPAISIEQITSKPPTENSRGLRLGSFVLIRAAIEDELEQAFNGKKSAQEAMDEAVARGNRLLRQFEQTRP